MSRLKVRVRFMQVILSVYLRLLKLDHRLLWRMRSSHPSQYSEEQVRRIAAQFLGTLIREDACGIRLIENRRLFGKKPYPDGLYIRRGQKWLTFPQMNAAGLTEDQLFVREFGTRDMEVRWFKREPGTTWFQGRCLEVIFTTTLSLQKLERLSGRPASISRRRRNGEGEGRKGRKERKKRV